MSTLTAKPPPAASGRRPVPKRPAPSPHTVAVWAIVGTMLAAGLWSLYDLGISVGEVLERFQYGVEFASRLFPPEFPPLGELISLVAETLVIVFLATVLAMLFSLPVALFAAVNTTPSSAARGASRVVIILCRAIPDLVFALIFIRVVGTANGILIGVLAMGLSSIGMLGKLLADNIEDVDRGPSEAVTAAGGARWQWIASTVFPQILPQIVAHGLHRFDINLRSSVILGYVGVGGIGHALASALNTRQWQLGMGYILVIVVLCVAVELLSGAIRTALMGRDATGRRRGLWGLVDRLSQGWLDQSPGPHEAQRDRRGRIRVSPQWDLSRIQRFLGVAVFLALVLASVYGMRIDLNSLSHSVQNVPHVMGQFFPPDGGGHYWDRYFPAMVETVQIGLASLLLGLFVAIPIGSLAARNVAPNPLTATFFRVVIVLARAVPELVLAIIFLVILGFNATSAVLALAFGSIGLLSKLVADSLEESDIRVQDAVRAGGADRTQVYVAATVRQTAPATVAHILYQLDVNIRAATLLGVIGAGGIGFDLLQASTRGRYDVLCLLIINVIIVVVLVEAIALYIRRTVR